LFISNPLQQVEISFYWPEYKAKIAITDKKALKDFIEKYEQGEDRPGLLREEDKYYEMVLKYKKGEKILYLDKNLNLYNPQSTNYKYSPYVVSFLTKTIYDLESAFFGKTINWWDFTEKFPKGASVKVRDIITGETFTIKRYGGLTHADVEPASEHDTEVLKRIYGNWSWKRRGVVVYLGNERYAASINGMPHGAGRIYDNEFRGHFCLHLEDSKVHKSWRVDPGHQLMIHKAAGKLPEFLDEASPEDLTGYMVAAVVSEDFLPIRYTSANPPDEELWKMLVEQIRFIQVNSLDEMAVNDDEYKVSADITIYRANSADFYRKTMDVVFTRDSFRNSWRLNFETLGPLLNPD